MFKSRSLSKKIDKFFLNSTIFLILFLLSSNLFLTFATPTSPTDLEQYESDDSTLIPTGANSDGTDVYFHMQMSSDTGGEGLTPQVEIKAVGSSFADSSTYVGSGVTYNGSPVEGTVRINESVWASFTDGEEYHWQARVCDTFDSSDCSSWVSYGGNSDPSEVDFMTPSTTGSDPYSPSSLGPSDVLDSNQSNETTPTFNFNLSDSDSSDQVKYNIQIDNNSTFESPEVNYVSALTTQDLSVEGQAYTEESFTVGQAAGSGFYTTGSSGQTLSSDGYWWRVKTIDENGNDSSFSTSSGESTAFFYVETTVPTITDLGQYQADGTTSISTSGVYKYYTQEGETVSFQATLNDSGEVDSFLYFSVEVEEVGTAFDDVATDTSDGILWEGSDLPVTGQIDLSSTLSSGSSYHWQAKVCDTAGNCSAWTSFGGNSDPNDVDFELNTKPNDPTSLGPSGLASGGYVTDTTPTLQFDVTDSNTGDDVGYQLQIDEDSGYGSLEVNCANYNFTAQGTLSFTVGQAGCTGDAGTTLSDGDYYWRVRSFDEDYANSSYVDANSGSVAFILDTTPPTASNLAQYQSDGTTAVSTGGSLNSTSTVLKMDASDNASSTTLTPEFEVREVGTPFSDTATDTGSGIAYSGTTTTASATVTGLSEGSEYHWQSRLCDSAGNCSSWSSYGGNAESAADFDVVLNVAPNAPSSLGPAGLVNGSYTTDSTPTLSFTLDDPDTSDQVRYKIQIDNSSGFGSPVVDYTSVYDAEGVRSFTVGQSAGSGTYTTGSASQTLSDTSYYWRVLAEDDDNETSSYTTANSGSVAFILDTTDPVEPEDIEVDGDGSDPYTSDDRPEFSWKTDDSASTYKIEIDNGDEGDFSISGISASGSGKEEHNKYDLEYDDDKITFQTNSSDDWNDDDNDGEVKEGEREVTITATDEAGNTSEDSPKFYVDKTEPTAEVEEINGISFEDNMILTASPTSIKIKITDELAGDENDVASGPDSGKIVVKQSLFGTYVAVESQEFDFDKEWDDNDSDKYVTYTLEIDDGLNNGDYRIEITAKDNVENEVEEEFDFVLSVPIEPEVPVTPLPEEPAPEPSGPVTPGEEEPTPPEDSGEDEDEMKYEVIITVKDQDGNPLSDAEVGFDDSDFESNENGDVLVGGVEEGEYKVRVSYKGQEREENVVLSGEIERHKIDITLPVVDRGEQVSQAVGRTVEKSKEFIEDNTAGAAAISTAAISTVALSSLFMPTSTISMLEIPQYTGLTGPSPTKTIPFLFTGLLKKKKKPWGVVYDAVSKQPLDPVVITLTSESGEEYQSVTDIYGRYEFLVNPGKYKIDVKKTSYQFPSKKVFGTDLVYSNVLVNNEIEVKEGDKVRYNIPMDRIKKDWNQLEKLRMGIKGHKKYLDIIGTVSFWLGLSWAALVAFVEPTKLNLTVFGLFILVLAFRIISDYVRSWGVIKDSEGDPLTGEVVKLQNAKFPQMSPDKAVTDDKGRYNFLVEKGKYKVIIESKNYVSDVIEMNKDYGSIGFDIRL